MRGRETIGSVEPSPNTACAGDVATLMAHHVVPGVEDEGYSVEFFDMTGNTAAVVTVSASALRLPTLADRSPVRARSA